MNVAFIVFTILNFFLNVGIIVYLLLKHADILDDNEDQEERIEDHEERIKELEE